MGSTGIVSRPGAGVKADFTGVKWEAPQDYGLYYGGRWVGSRPTMSQAESTLAEIRITAATHPLDGNGPARPTVEVKGPAVQPAPMGTQAVGLSGAIPASPAATPQATASKPQRVTVITKSARDFPGARIIRNEELLAIILDSGQPRPPKAGANLTTTIGWLAANGYKPEATTANGMAVWQELQDTVSYNERRRQVTFVREVQP